MTLVCASVATILAACLMTLVLCLSGYDFGCMINDSCLCFSGYDFGYMIRILSGDSLAVEEADFFGLLRLYFHNIYDVKYLMKSCKNLKGGLQEVADQLEVSGRLNSAVFVPLEDKMQLYELQGCQARLYSQPAAYTNLLPCSTVCI